MRSDFGESIPTYVGKRKRTIYSFGPSICALEGGRNSKRSPVGGVGTTGGRIGMHTYAMLIWMPAHSKAIGHRGNALILPKMV